MATKKKIKPWIVETAIEEIQAGKTNSQGIPFSLAYWDERNPELAAAIRKQMRNEPVVAPYSLKLWDKNGQRRVYINGGQETSASVWFEESGNENDIAGFVVRSNGQFFHAHARISGTPAEAVAESCLRSLGMSLSGVTFDDLIFAANK